ncbi:MAG TPA: peptidoglycan-binding domain-containing protein [Catenuloplanes sp.]|jgi:hypothetical protein
MYKATRAALLAAATVAMSAAVLTTTPQSASAAPTCTRTATVTAVQDAGDLHPFRINVPSTGTTAASTSCDMGVGAQSSAVRALQLTLNKCYDADLGQPDGIFGTRTRAALRDAQRIAGMSTNQRDGVYGPLTRNRIRHYNGEGYPCKRYDGR